MDNEIEELKEMVRSNTKLIEDTNRTIHNMQRSAQLARAFKVLVYLAVAAVSWYFYYTYVWPHVQQILDAYGSAQDFQVQVKDWFAQFGTK